MSREEVHAGVLAPDVGAQPARLLAAPSPQQRSTPGARVGLS